MTGARDLSTAAAQRGDVYRRLGVEPIVNAATTMTYLGGSLMPPEVLDAMRQAADSFVDMYELQSAVGRRIAEVTSNEAAFVSGGAAAGLFLSAAVCMARDTEDGILRPTELDGLPRDFIIHRRHRIPYDSAIELAGGRLVEIGSETQTNEADLADSIGRETAGILFVAGDHLADGALSLEAVVRVAKRSDIPVIVDAAAQLPPIENLWAFGAAGADLALFSGGKGLCGPASTGLVLGSRRYVERFERNAAPRQRMGRPMKVGKEDLVGILAAVEWYLRQDHEALADRYEAMVEHLIGWGRDRSDVTVTRETPGQAGQPTPRALIRLHAPISGRRDEILGALRGEPPRVELLAEGEDALFFAPETLVPGEEVVVTRRLGAVLDAIAVAQQR